MSNAIANIEKKITQVQIEVEKFAANAQEKLCADPGIFTKTLLQMHEEHIKLINLWMWLQQIRDALVQHAAAAEAQKEKGKLIVTP